MGARVIKVESPDGDPMRLTRSREAGGGPTAPTFAAYNVLKQTVALDLKNAVDLAVARQLCGTADVVVEAFRPGVMDRLGLGYEELSADNPGLVYAALSAFGETGPEQKRGGVDIVLQAETGLMSVTGDDGPMKAGVPIIDAASAMTLATGVLGALVGRFQSGCGRKVTTSMLDVGVFLQAQQFAEFLNSDVLPPRVGNRAAYAAPAEMYPVADGMLVLSAHIKPHWKALCAILGHPEWVEDERFLTVEDRVRNRDALNEGIADVLITAPAEDWLTRFAEAGITAGRVRDYREVVDSPQIAANGTIVAASNVDGSPMRVVRTPIRFSDYDDLVLDRRVRGIGADGDALFATKEPAQ